jgi:hypothetical protein
MHARHSYSKFDNGKCNGTCESMSEPRGRSQSRISESQAERHEPPSGYVARNFLKHARTSAMKSSGCSNAAKCPPLGISLQ